MPISPRFLFSAWLYALVIFCSPSGRAEPVKAITKLSEVRSLSFGQASQKRPVDLTAQIVSYTPSRGGMFIFDGQIGSYIALRSRKYLEQGFVPGTIVRIQGISDPGGFLPMIRERSLKKVGTALLPEATPLTHENLFLEKMDAEWIEAEGVVVNSATRGNVYTLWFETAGQIIEIALPNQPHSAEIALNLMHRKIKVQGVLCTNFNSRRQLVGRRINLTNFSSIEVITRDTSQLPLTELGNIFGTGRSPGSLIKVRGTVIHQEKKRLFIQQNHVGFVVNLIGEEGYNRGDVIEAYGPVSVQSFSPELRARSVKVIKTGFPISPHPLKDLSAANLLDRHNTLVTYDAQLLDTRENLDRLVLTCSYQNLIIKVSCPLGIFNPEQLVPGSELQLSGIHQLVDDDPYLSTFENQSALLRLRDFNDLQILSKPSWWTAERIFNVLGVVCAIAIIATIWAIMLRRRVMAQTATISAQIEREAVANERQRLARELHDSLEQNMSGLAMQLDTVIINHDRKEKEGTQTALDLARKMVSHCQRESRESIYDLRSGDKISPSSSWHDEMILIEAERAGAEITTTHKGKAFPLSKNVQRHLRKIVREATINALRHGKAQKIQIQHDYKPTEHTIIIKDDGCGFDSSQSIPDGHFGIIGMQERTHRIGGRLSIQSSPNKGTIVTITVPIKSTHP